MLVIKVSKRCGISERKDVVVKAGFVMRADRSGRSGLVVCRVGRGRSNIAVTEGRSPMRYG